MNANKVKGLTELNPSGWQKVAGGGSAAKTSSMDALVYVNS
jgi:hypothetical protein